LFDGIRKELHRTRASTIIGIPSDGLDCHGAR
jgi:hypothetical protein